MDLSSKQNMGARTDPSPCEQSLRMASPDLGYRGLASEGDDLPLPGLRFLSPAMLVQTLKHLAVLSMHRLSIQGIEAISRSKSMMNRKSGVCCEAIYVNRGIHCPHRGAASNPLNVATRSLHVCNTLRCTPAVNPTIWGDTNMIWTFTTATIRFARLRPKLSNTNEIRAAPTFVG